MLDCVAATLTEDIVDPIHVSGVFSINEHVPVFVMPYGDQAH
jgi:hypothetical protein